MKESSFMESKKSDNTESDSESVKYNYKLIL